MGRQKTWEGWQENEVEARQAELFQHLDHRRFESLFDATISLFLLQRRLLFLLRGSAKREKEGEWNLDGEIKSRGEGGGGGVGDFV